GSFLPRQFCNEDNAAAHELGTAQEILDQIPQGHVDAVVSGVGTGGTLVGLYRGLRVKNPGLRAFLARPIEISEAPDVECCSFGTNIPGVVDGVSKIFAPARFASLTTIEVVQRNAIDTALELVRRGFPVGPSSGLNYLAAVQASREMNADARI